MHAWNVMVDALKLPKYKIIKRVLKYEQKKLAFCLQNISCAKCVIFFLFFFEQGERE
jgi:hypothetical protein